MSEEPGGGTESDRPRTLGALRASGYATCSVREEMRRNLLGMLARGERLLPGIIGFDTSVIPEVENALLAGHHMVFLGERGQAKSRIIRGLTALLDPAVPAVRGCALHDDRGTARHLARAVKQQVREAEIDEINERLREGHAIR